MKFRNVRVIALKEFRDVLRDRRTLIFMMLLPVAVMPLLMIGLTKFMMVQKRSKAERAVTIAVEPAARAAIMALGKEWVAENRDHWVAWQARNALIEAKQAGLLDAMLASGEVTEQEAADAKLPDPDLRRERGIANARAVQRVIELAEFIDLSDVAGAGKLTAGVEIPEQVPQALNDPRLAVAIQDKEIDAAVYLPPDALV